MFSQCIHGHYFPSQFCPSCALNHLPPSFYYAKAKPAAADNKAPPAAADNKASHTEPVDPVDPVEPTAFDALSVVADLGKLDRLTIDERVGIARAVLAITNLVLRKR